MTDGAKTKKEDWVLRCAHPDYPNAERDFSEFVIGAGTEATSPSSRHKWLGPFSGRPGLLYDLFPTMVRRYGDLPPSRLSMLASCMRAFWRFLDKYEAWLQANQQSVPRIDRLHQITGAVLELWWQPGPSAGWDAVPLTMGRTFRALIVDAIYERGLDTPIISVLPGRYVSRKDTPTEDEALSLIRFLRYEVASIFKRWVRADRLALEGRDLIEILHDNGNKWPNDQVATEADAHATYRSLIQRIGNPLPTALDLQIALNPGGSKRRQTPIWWPRYCENESSAGAVQRGTVSWSDCTAGLYPTSQDVSICALLCLARSAWNPATLLSLDVNNWHSQYDDENSWIYAPKMRAGGALQHSVSPIKSSTGMYAILSKLIDRTRSLREWISSHPDSFRQSSLALRSPWIGSSNKPSDFAFVLDPRNSATMNGWLKILIARHNANPSRSAKVRHLTASDFRDIAAAVMYRRSHYSMWVIKLMLGHKDLATTSAYGYRQANRNESHELVAQVFNKTFEQIQHTRTWRASLTRAHVENVEVTSEDMDRLNAYRERRTYSGAICMNPRQPPPSIDPTHPQDGRSRCAQGHLCIARACPQSVVLEDSLSDICKSVVELEWKQRHLGLVRFSVGSEERDLSFLRRTLEQWPMDEVRAHMEMWRSRIANGEHRPLLFAGVH